MCSGAECALARAEIAAPPRPSTIESSSQMPSAWSGHSIGPQTLYAISMRRRALRRAEAVPGSTMMLGSELRAVPSSLQAAAGDDRGVEQAQPAHVADDMQEALHEQPAQRQPPAEGGIGRRHCVGVDLEARGHARLQVRPLAVRRLDGQAAQAGQRDAGRQRVGAAVEDPDRGVRPPVGLPLGQRAGDGRELRCGAARAHDVLADGDVSLREPCPPLVGAAAQHGREAEGHEHAYRLRLVEARPERQPSVLDVDPDHAARGPCARPGVEPAAAHGGREHRSLVDDHEQARVVQQDRRRSEARDRSAVHRGS